MTLTLQLPADLEARLLQEAQADGTAPAGYALAALRAHLERQAAEDTADLALAEERVATTDSSQWRTLDELRATRPRPAA